MLKGIKSRDGGVGGGNNKNEVTAGSGLVDVFLYVGQKREIIGYFFWVVGRIERRERLSFLRGSIKD